MLPPLRPASLHRLKQWPGMPPLSRHLSAAPADDRFFRRILTLIN
jgi:hypothetical protein